ncbi:MAG: TetR/AcrR family transcriptional regulator [Hyphomicrobiaceae bacterium]
MHQNPIGQLQHGAPGEATRLSDQKHQSIIAAATEVFLQLGYGAASMDSIASEAKVSKQTIYNHFHSKEELFKAIIAGVTVSLMEPLCLEGTTEIRPEQQLRRFARDFFELMLQPSSLALYRLIIAESARFPELGPSIYDAGAGKLIEVLAEYLARQTQQGALAVSKPQWAAEQFIGMLSGRVQFRALLAEGERPSSREIDGRVEHAVTAFLKQYAAE